MPSVGEYVPNYDRFSAFDINDAGNFEVVRLTPGLQQPIQVRSGGWDASRGPTVVEGEWYDPMDPVQLSLTGRGFPPVRLPAADSAYRPGVAPVDRPQRSTALADLVAGQRDRAELVDPALLGGALNRWDVTRPGVANALNPEIPIEVVVAESNLPRGVVERIRKLGVVPGPTGERVPETTTPPGTVTRGVRRTRPASESPEAAATYLELLDATPRTDVRWEPNVGLTAGMDGPERFPVDYGTGLPSDVPIGMRGASGVLRQENQALGADLGGFMSQDPESVSLRSRQWSSDIAPFGPVDVVVAGGDGTYSVRSMDPTVAVRQETLDPDSTAPFGRSRDQSLGSAVQAAAESAKTPIISQSALQAAQRAGRFTPLPEDQREGTLVGYITGADYDRLLPVGKDGRRAKGTVPVYAPLREDGSPLMSSDENRERLYRIGSPLNRVDHLFREALRDIPGLEVSSYFGPQANRPVALADLERALGQGYEIFPAGSPLLGSTREGLLGQVQALRGRPRESISFEVARDGKVVQSLVPEVDKGGRMTGRLLPLATGEAGPAMLLNDTLARIKGQEFGERRGGMFGRAGLERESSALGKGSFMETTPTVDGNLVGLVPMIASGRLSAADIEADARLAQIFRPGSYARTILDQDLASRTGGTVRLNWADAIPATTAETGSGLSPWQQFSTAPAAQARPPQVVQGELNLSGRSLQGEAAAQLLGSDGQAFLSMPGERIPGSWTYGGRSAPSYLDQVAEYMASRPQAAAGRVVPTPVQMELPLQYNTSDPGTGQLSLPVTLPRRFTPSYLDDLGAYMARQADERGLSAPVFASDPREAGMRQFSGEATAPLPGFGLGEVRATLERPVGRAAGPYAGAPYYGTLDRSRYQGSLSGRPGFDYADMAERLDGEVGSPAQELAMRQLAMRIAARARGATEPSTPSWLQAGLF